MHRTVLVLTLLVATAAAAANAKATALARDAEKAYKDNRYQDAAELLRQAWEADPVPKFLYNMARAHDQAGALEPAVEAYGRYVALPSDETDAELAKKANLALERVRTQVAQRETAKKSPDSSRQRPEAEPRGAAALKVEAKAGTEGQSALGKLGTRRIAALAAGGAAVVGLGLAVSFGLVANGSRAAFGGATTVADKRNFESATRTQAAVADVSLVVGLGAAVAALVLFPQGSAAEGAVSVSLGPTSGGAFASVGGPF